jgi:hypothetical protein
MLPKHHPWQPEAKDIHWNHAALTAVMNAMNIIKMSCE